MTLRLIRDLRIRWHMLKLAVLVNWQRARFERRR